jgi:arylsulfatase A-like enzyme
MKKWLKTFAIGATATLALALVDLVATGWLYGGLLGTAGHAIIFLALAAGALTTLLLPLSAALSAASRFLAPKPRIALATAALGMALVTLLVNAGLLGEHPLFTLGLTALTGCYGAGLMRLEQGAPLPYWALLLFATIGIYLIDATQLRGLYVSQHLTLGILCWLSTVVLFRKTFQPFERVRPILALGLAVPTLLAVAVFWSAPGDAIGEDLRYALHHGSTATRNAMHVLSYATDWDGDGYPVLLGRGDCEPLNDAAHPGALEIIGDGIDQNCLAGDPPAEVVAAYREWAQPVATANLAQVDNVILITIDALRFDRVVGPKANPVLVDIASQGVFFNSAYCLYPGTIPSLYGMAVSDYPSAISYTPFQSFEFPFEDTRTTLFEVLESAKIRQFAAAYHMMLAPRFGITRGIFEVWAPSDSAEGISSAETTKKGLAFLDQAKDGRFFLWLHYFDPHAPYEVLEGETSKTGAEGRYDAEVARAALEVERFLDELISRGLSENTAVILAADHGEEFGDHGATHHGQALYEESTHIPLLMILPSGPSRVVTTPVSLLDLAPTIIDLLGLEVSTPESWKGRTLAPYVMGEMVPRPFPVYLEAYRPGGKQRTYGLVMGDHKFVYRPALELFELYDLASDPGESRNLAGLPAGEAVEPTLRGLLDLHLAVDY